MKRIDLDFASTPRPAGPARWLSLIVGVVCLSAVTGWNHLYWQPRIAAEADHLQSMQTTLEARRPAALKIEDAQLAAEWARAMSVAGELNLPWEKLFATFEAEAERPVALLSLEPDVVKGELILTAEAKNFEEMLAYYRMLQQQDNLSAVVLHTHQVNQQDQEKPIRFRITAKWVVNS